MYILKEALKILAEGNNQGLVSDDMLIKACEISKIETGFVENETYDIMVSKSVFDYINGVNQDIEICKAIIPGQTKMVDGIMYVYSATKRGAKNNYDWHVVKKGGNTKLDIGRGSKVSDAAIDSKQKFVNELFPKDLSSLKVIKTLGGSTGAKLMEDVNGIQYVMKRGSNTNNEHVKSEYISNQLYNILGQRTPDYELYESNSSDVTLLSRFIPGTRVPSSGDYKKMSEGFIADVVLANWDIYQNDNCLVDAGGRIIRVDNGGSLKFKAKGDLKPSFDGNALDTYKSMSRYNPGIISQLSNDDIIKQISEISSKKDDIVNFLKESGEDELAKILGDRINDLKRIEDEINLASLTGSLKVQKKMSNVLPRNLKSKKDMYGNIEEEKTDEIWKNYKSKTYSDLSALVEVGTNGWAILSELCDIRGFNARPNVVTPDDFWKFAANAKNPVMYRGQQRSGGKTGENFNDEFRFSDTCFYGNWGIWGQGIYAHVDDHNGKNLKSNQNNYKNSEPYREGLYSYSDGTDESVLKMLWEDDAKLIDSDDLLDMAKSDIPIDSNSDEVVKINQELGEIKKEWTDNELKLQNVSKAIIDEVHKSMNYNADSVIDMYDSIDNTNWGEINAQGERDYPDYDNFVLGKMSNWVTDNGGKVDINSETETVYFSFGGSRFYIAKYSWQTNNIKRKNGFSSAYNFQAEKFKSWFETSCISKVDSAVKKAVSESDKISSSLKQEIKKNESDYYAKQNELKVLINKTDSIHKAVYNQLQGVDYRDNGTQKSILGIYAALKGYDGIYVKNGNGGRHGYEIILNRSKIITSVE